MDISFISLKKVIALFQFPSISYGFLCILGILGCLAATSAFKWYWGLLALLGVHTASILAFFISDRYRLPIVIYWALFSAIFFQWLADQLRRVRLREPIKLSTKVTAVIMVIVFSALATIVFKPLGLKETPGSFHFRMGIAYLGSMNLPEAQKHFSECVNRDPTWIEARYRLAEVWYREGDYEPALRELAILEPVNNPAVPYLHGLVQQNMGIAHSAIISFTKALQSVPAGTPFNMADDARNRINTLMVARNDTAAHQAPYLTFSSQAEQLVKTGRTYSGLAFYQEALLCNPLRADSLSLLAIVDTIRSKMRGSP
jgi:tetratricopeptide (TPR) repeat protein